MILKEVETRFYANSSVVFRPGEELPRGIIYRFEDGEEFVIQFNTTVDLKAHLTNLVEQLGLKVTPNE